MIKKLESIDPLNYDKSYLEEFIKRTSPFTDTNPRLLYLIEEFFKKGFDTSVTISMNDKIIDPKTKENKIKMFMLWFNNKTLYTGTAFVRESEMNTGIEFKNYESAE